MTIAASTSTDLRMILAVTLKFCHLNVCGMIGPVHGGLVGLWSVAPYQITPGITGTTGAR